MGKTKIKTDAEKICAHVLPECRPQAVTLAVAVLTLQKKIEDKTREYEKADMTQEVMKMNGSIEDKVNPFVVEYRAMVRDYAAALKSLHEMIEKNAEPAEISSLDDLRKGLKICL